MKNENTAQLIEPAKGRRESRLWRGLAVAAGSAALFAAGCGGESDNSPGGEKNLGPEEVAHIEKLLDTPKEDLSDASNPPAEDTVSLISGEDVSLDELENFCQTERDKAQEQFSHGEAVNQEMLDEVATLLPYVSEDGEQKVYTCK
jgi:hypothetical protein